jgi:hypothetical protein
MWLYSWANSEPLFRAFSTVRTLALGMVISSSSALIAAFATEPMSMEDLEVRYADSVARIVLLFASGYWRGSIHLGHDTSVEQIQV